MRRAGGLGAACTVAFSVPVGQLAVFVLAAALAGLGAGWFPARRAARLEVLRAIAVQ